MATFREGLEAAAKLIEGMAQGCLDQRVLADRIRAIQEPPAVPAVVTDLEAAFRRFKLAYVQAGGFRNPKSIDAKGWGPAEKKFVSLVRRRKHDSEAIITGTLAYAATRPEANFVPAPEVFLNGEQFMRDWARARSVQRQRPVSYDDIENYFQNQIDPEPHGPPAQR